MLDAEELAAIRGAIGQALAGAVRNQRAETHDAVPVALIADDQAGERARPDALRIASRWVPVARQRMLRGLGVKLELIVSGAEIISGSFLREELAQAWTRVLKLSGRDSIGLFAVSGPVIESLAGRLLGGLDEPAPFERPPTSASLSVFSRAGEMLLTSLADAWREEQAVHVSALPDAPASEALRRSLLENDALLALTIGVSGSTSGRIRLITPPGAIVAPAPATRLAATSPELLERALGQVPIELRVDLGHARLTMSQIAELRPGSLITLQQPIDALLPVRCGGVVKAYGRPTIWKGALAVEIAERSEGSDT